MTPRQPRILVSAGEPSGDLHGAAVVRALRARWPGAVIEAFGGPRMAEAGATVRWPMEGFAAFGLVEVVEKIPAHLRLLRTLEAGFRARAWDLVIPIDYPGFHLRLAESAHRAGLRVLYYIAPQLWAWRPGRARKLAAHVDRLAVVLPFEEAFFRGLGVPATYVGHPLLDRAPGPGRAAARARLGLPAEGKVLGLFPGSRHGEVRRLWGPFRDAARRLLDEGACERVVVAGTARGEYPDAGPIEVHRDDPLAILAASDAMIAKSGTTTLECALADVPMVVAYRLHPVTYHITLRMVKLRRYSLVNLVAGRDVVPELIQGDATADRLVAETRPLLDPASAAARRQREGLREVRDRLGLPGAAERVAALAAELLPAA